MDLPICIILTIWAYNFFRIIVYSVQKFALNRSDSTIQKNNFIYLQFIRYMVIASGEKKSKNHSFTHIHPMCKPHIFSPQFFFFFWFPHQESNLPNFLISFLRTMSTTVTLNCEIKGSPFIFHGLLGHSCPSDTLGDS